MKRLILLLVASLLVVGTLIAFAQTEPASQQPLLQEAQRIVKQLGYSGPLRYNGPINGEVYVGKGFNLQLGALGVGSLIVECKPGVLFNKATQPVASAEEAIQRAKDFLEQYAQKLNLPQPGPDLKTSVTSQDTGEVSGWKVTLRAYEQGHPALPSYSVVVDDSGAIRDLVYVPLTGQVASEAKITKEEARTALLKQVGLENQKYDFNRAELTVWLDPRTPPDTTDGPQMLMWRLDLVPVDPKAPKVMGEIDAVTGEVLASGTTGTKPPAPPPGYQPPPYNRRQHLQLPTKLYRQC